MSTQKITGVKAVILVTAVALGPSDPLGVWSVSRVAGKPGVEGAQSPSFANHMIPTSSPDMLKSKAAYAAAGRLHTLCAAGFLLQDTCAASFLLRE